MTKLFLASVLAVSFLFPGVSFGAESIFGVNVPLERQALEGNVQAGYYIAKDHSLVDTLISQKLKSDKTSVSGDEERKDSYYVFGVDIKAKNQI